jgi:hypothetical protein
VNGERTGQGIFKKPFRNSGKDLKMKPGVQFMQGSHNTGCTSGMPEPVGGYEKCDVR